MTSLHLGLTLIGDKAKTGSMAGIFNTATRLSSNWREA